MAKRTPPPLPGKNSAAVNNDERMIVGDDELFTGDDEKSVPDSGNQLSGDKKIISYTRELKPADGEEIEMDFSDFEPEITTPLPRYIPKESGLPSVMVAEDAAKDEFDASEVPTQPALKRAKDETPVRNSMEESVEAAFFAEGDRQSITNATLAMAEQASLERLAREEQNYKEAAGQERGFAEKLFFGVLDKLAAVFRDLAEREENITSFRTAQDGIENLQAQIETRRGLKEKGRVWAHDGGSEIEQGFKAKMGDAKPGLGEEHIAMGELKRAFDSPLDFDEEMAKLKLTTRLGGKTFDAEGNVVPDPEAAQAARGNYERELREQEAARAEARAEHLSELQTQEKNRLNERHARREELLARAGATPEIVDGPIMRKHDAKFPATDIPASMRAYDEQYPAIDAEALLKAYDKKTAEGGSDIQRDFRAKKMEGTSGEKLTPGLKEDTTPERPSFLERVSALAERAGAFGTFVVGAAAFVVGTMAAAMNLGPRLHSTDGADMADAKAAEPLQKADITPQSTSHTLTSATRIPADASLNNPALEAMRREQVASAEAIHENAMRQLGKKADADHMVSLETLQGFAQALKDGAATTAQQEAAANVLSTLNALEIVQNGQKIQNMLGMKENPITAPLERDPSIHLIREVTHEQATAEFHELNRTYAEKAQEGYLLVSQEQLAEVDAHLNPGRHAKDVQRSRLEKPSHQR